MKKLLALILVLLVAGMAYAEPYMVSEEKDEGPKPICPVTLVAGELRDCMECHVAPSWKIKETAPYAEMKDALPSHTKIVERDGKPALGYFLTNISDYDVCAVRDWLAWHPDIKHLVVEIHSPGGSLFNAQRISGIIDELKSKEIIVETVCYGFAASAGFYILASGSKDHRFVAQDAQLMWHELISFKMFDISSPADKEDEADVLRHLQNTANGRISRLTGIPTEELDRLTRKKELWLNGGQALELGLVDGLTGQ